MPSRTILSPAQRSATFDPPADQTTIERLNTPGPDKLGQVALRRVRRCLPPHCLLTTKSVAEPMTSPTVLRARRRFSIIAPRPKPNLV